MFFSLLRSSSPLSLSSSPSSPLRLLPSLFQCRGYKRTVHKQLKNTIEKGWVYAYRDRREKTRVSRQLSIMRVNAGPVRYAELKHRLDDVGVALNAKSLERLYIAEPDTMSALIGGLEGLKGYRDDEIALQKMERRRRRKAE